MIKKPSGVMLLKDKSGTGRECPEQIKGIFLDVEAWVDKEDDEVGVLIFAISNIF